MIQKFNCPSCGAENSFKSAASLFAVCPYCRASIFRNENEVELIGTVSDIAEDNSPLQLGTQGQFMGKAFTIVGRTRMKWSDGFWNEWHLFMSDGKSAWIGEAQGEFMLTLEVPIEDKKILNNNLVLMDKIKLKGNEFIIVDIKESEVFMAEGELPFRAHSGDKRLSADFRMSFGVGFGSLEKDIPSGDTRAYVGTIVQLSDLKLTHVRKFDGW